MLELSLFPAIEYHSIKFKCLINNTDSLPSLCFIQNAGDKLQRHFLAAVGSSFEKSLSCHNWLIPITFGCKLIDYEIPI